MSLKKICVVLCLIVGCENSSALEKDRGVVSSRSAIITDNSESDYVDECRELGVPVPTTVADLSDGWTNHGILSTSFISITDPMTPGSLESELWSWVSEDLVSPGICLALPRWNGADEAVLFGVICLGTRTSRACFFDNPNGDFAPRYTAPPIEFFVGGTDLAGNGGGECTTCHAGQNPFITHPEDPAFADFLLERRRLVRQAPEWYQPVIPDSPGWVHNPGPIALPPAPMGEQSCATSTCHGREHFPNIAAIPLGYCDSVLMPALDGGTGFSPTMPLSIPGDYDTHIDFLERLCGWPAANPVLESGSSGNDLSFISKPQLDPMFECSTSIVVRNAKMGATVELDGPENLTALVTNPDAVIFTVPFLEPGQWRARQSETPGVWSVWTEWVDVQPYSELYPELLPVEVTYPLYECSNTIAVRHIPGGTLHVSRNSAAPTTHAGSALGHTGVVLGADFAVGEQLNVYQSFCPGEDVGPPLPVPVIVESAPPLGLPITAPVNLYQGQQLINFGAMVPGSSQTLVSSMTASQSWGSWSTGRRPVYVGTGSAFGRPLIAGETLTLTQSLCEVNSAPYVAPPVSACYALPAAQIVDPREGDTFVSVIGPHIPGATTRVISETLDEEIGDSGGTIINLARPVLAGETLLVYRELPGCVSNSHYRYMVY